MCPLLVRWYYVVAGALLLAGALAKLVSAAGSAHILQYPDPILGMQFGHVFEFVATLELAIALVCFFSKRLALQAGLVAWLATSFLIYRIGLLWVGYQKPCSCLGSLTDALDISPQTADMVLKTILAYLFVGGYTTLFWLRRQKRKTSLSIAR